MKMFHNHINRVLPVQFYTGNNNEDVSLDCRLENGLPNSIWLNSGFGDQVSESLNDIDDWLELDSKLFPPFKNGNQAWDIIYQYLDSEVEEIDGINQEAIHTGFYFLTSHDNLCEVYYLVNEKKLCFQGVLDKSWYLCPLGVCHYRIQTDYEHRYRIRFTCPGNIVTPTYYNCNTITNELNTRRGEKSFICKRGNYNLISLFNHNYFSFVGPFGVKNFPLYSPIFPRLIVSNGSHYCISDSVTK